MVWVEQPVKDYARAMCENCRACGQEPPFVVIMAAQGRDLTIASATDLLLFAVEDLQENPGNTLALQARNSLRRGIGCA